MDINQLQDEFRQFRIKQGYPKIFLFLSTTVTSKDAVEYSANDTESFVRKSLEICKSHSNAFENAMGRML